MKWFLAACAFAAVVGLAIGTATIRAENIRRRALLQRMTERLDALRVGRAAERARLEEGREPDRLVLRWAELSEALERRLLR